MTSHVSAAGRVCAAVVLALASTAPGAVAAAPSPAVRAGAVELELGRADLAALGTGLAATLAGRLSGSQAGPFVPPAAEPGAPTQASDLAVGFRIAAVRLTPETGRLHAELVVQDVEASVGHVAFAAGEPGCTDVVVSRAGSLRVSADLIPVGSGGPGLDVANLAIPLSDRELELGERLACQGLTDAAQRLRESLPWLAGLIRAGLSAQVQAVLAGAVRDLASQLGAGLPVSLTVPFRLTPQPRASATVTLAPEAIAVSRAGLRLKFAANLGTMTLGQGTAPANGMPVGLRALWRPGSLRLAKGLLTDLAQAARDAGLFAMAIDATSMPGAGTALRAGSLYAVLPDARRRFAPDTELTLTTGSGAAPQLRLKPCGPGGIPIIDVLIPALPMTLALDGDAYVEASLDLSLRLALQTGADAALRFAVVGVDADLTEAHFAAGLDPAPEAAEVDLAGLSRYLSAAFLAMAQAAGDDDPVLALALPSLGGRRLTVVGAAVGDDFVTLPLELR